MHNYLNSWSEIPGFRPGRTQIKLKCPSCSHLRKNKTDTPLSVNTELGVGNCKHCGDTFSLKDSTFTDHSKPIKEYTPPVIKNLTALSDEGLKFFTDRRIKQETIKHFRIGMQNGNIFIPYIVDDEVINYKTRGVKEKRWSQAAGAKPVMYAYDLCKGENIITIQEGEMDALVAWQATGYASTSVNQGAINPSDQNVEGKLQCVFNSYDLFEEAETIYIAVDQDAPGERLEKELIRVLPEDKVLIVSWDEKYKDLNDCLMWEGEEYIKECFDNAKPPNIDGTFSIDDVDAEIDRIYDEGLPMGSTTYFPSIDPYWKWRPGELTVISSYQNEGKSEITSHLALVKSFFDGWRVAAFSPENMPIADFYENLIHQYVGKTLDISYEGSHVRATKQQVQEAKDWLRDRFFLVNPSSGDGLNDFKLTSILDRMKRLVKTKGIRICILDPFNLIQSDQDKGERDDVYATRVLAELKNFALRYQVAVLLVIHQRQSAPTSTGDSPKPSTFGIRGGGSFAEVADNVCFIHRPWKISNPSDPMVVWYSDKIRKQKYTGTLGSCTIFFDWKARRYKDELLQDRCPLEVTPIEMLRLEKGDKEMEFDDGAAVKGSGELPF